MQHRTGACRDVKETYVARALALRVLCAVSDTKGEETEEKPCGSRTAGREGARERGVGLRGEGGGQGEESCGRGTGCGGQVERMCRGCAVGGKGREGVGSFEGMRRRPVSDFLNLSRPPPPPHPHLTPPFATTPPPQSVPVPLAMPPPSPRTLFQRSALWRSPVLALCVFTSDLESSSSAGLVAGW